MSDTPDLLYMGKGYNRRAVGAEYERRAGRCLEQRGYHILQYNYRCRMGEIDVIARDGAYLVFCEVKYRRGTGSGHPAEAVDLKKQRILSRCAAYYLMEQGDMDALCRFDVVCVEGESIHVIKHAFDCAMGAWE